MTAGDEEAADAALGGIKSPCWRLIEESSVVVRGRPLLRLGTCAANSDSINKTSTRRLLHALRQLAKTNTSISYDFLRERGARCGASKQLIESRSDLAGEGSTNSLLDIIIGVSCDSTAELLELTEFVDVVCVPLDNLPSNNSTADAETTGPDGLKIYADGSVAVPTVRLSNQSLRSFLELLLSDDCTRAVFKHIQAVVSRLAKVAWNRDIMIEVISEVILELAGQSQGRLEGLLSSLNSQTNVSVEGEKHLSTIKSLPLGEVGTRQHDCFLQVLSILVALSTDTKAALPALDGIWDVLDRVLIELQGYVGSASEMAQQQSILGSLLVKLQPVVEAFFLIHAHELLNGKADGRPKEEAVEGSATLVRMRSMPGSTARQTTEFSHTNISVSFDTGDERAPLQNTRSSMRRHSVYVAASRQQRLVMFVQSHADLLNMLVRARPALLEGTLSALIRVLPLRTHLLFDNKRVYFFSQLHKRTVNIRGRRGIHIQVRRGQIFEDSFHQLRDRHKEDLRGRLQVSFHGEEGIDAGGLTREWYLTLSREIFNPNYALFSPVDAATFQPNPLSFINTNHLDYFTFVGRIIGKAITDGHLMDAHFTRSFYKHVLGAAVDYNDLEALEPDYYKSLKQILEFPIDSLGLDLTFSAEIQEFGKYQVVDLVPGGRNLPVTDDNKLDYVQLVAQQRMTTGIRSQIDAFLRGFYELVPPELICIFSPTELELLICGLPDVDMDELKTFTDYHQFRVTDPCIVWFWEVVKAFSSEERALFLLFVTGTSKVSQIRPLVYPRLTIVNCRCLSEVSRICRECVASSASPSTRRMETLTNFPRHTPVSISLICQFTLRKKNFERKFYSP
jgi:E3 ubiquitin-protein ligase HUWE1